LQEEQDLLEQFDGVSFVYEKKIAPFVENKTIDYIDDGVQVGFAIRGEGSGSDCGSCSC